MLGRHDLAVLLAGGGFLVDRAFAPSTSSVRFGVSDLSRRMSREKSSVGKERFWWTREHRENRTSKETLHGWAKDLPSQSTSDLNDLNPSSLNDTGTNAYEFGLSPDPLLVISTRFVILLFFVIISNRIIPCDNDQWRQRLHRYAARSGQLIHHITTALRRLQIPPRRRQTNAETSPSTIRLLYLASYRNKKQLNRKRSCYETGATAWECLPPDLDAERDGRFGIRERFSRIGRRFGGRARAKNNHGFGSDRHHRGSPQRLILKAIELLRMLERLEGEPVAKVEEAARLHQEHGFVDKAEVPNAGKRKRKVDEEKGYVFEAVSEEGS
ncbi:hypothetical protein C8J56DRAFT_895266 [Mycena floridula]|nr:hypothetical protein C8J56DRAFT_895266 [Mycena floridula]